MKPRTCRVGRITAIAVFAVASLASPAWADSMLFVGVTSGTAVPSFGMAWGKWSAPIGFEVELSKSPGNSTASVGGNLLLDTPVTIRRARLYGTAGLGLFAAQHRDGKEIGGPAKNVGAGARIPLTSGVLIRVDYRVFFVESDHGDYKPGHAHRLATGISFTF